MGTLICTVELNKATGSGITVTVVNADGKITQTVQMDGTAMTLTVKGESDTSTITQKADSIAIACKTFTLDAETITCASTKLSKYASTGDSVELSSAKDMKLTSDAKLVQSATQNFEVSSQADVKLTATANASMDATAAAQVTAKQKLTLSGTAEVAMSGAQIKIAADAQLNAESTGIATVKGSITNIQGNLVNLG